MRIVVYKRVHAIRKSIRFIDLYKTFVQYVGFPNVCVCVFVCVCVSRNLLVNALVIVNVWAFQSGFTVNVRGTCKKFCVCLSEQIY